MDLKQLRKDLKLLPHLISIVGTETVFIQQAKSEIIKFFINKGTEDFNLNFIESESDKEILTYIQEMPFDSDFKVVFLNNAKKFQYKVPNTTILVSLDNSIEKPHLVIDCKKLYGRSLRAYVSSRAKALSLDFDKDDVAKFVELNGNDLRVLENELYKISLLGEKSFKVFKELGATNLTSKLDDIAKALATKNVFQALKSYEDLIDLGSSPSSIFGYIVYIYKCLFNVIFLKDNSELEDYDLRKFYKLKQYFDFEFIKKSLFYLDAIDYKVRSGLFPMSVLLICLVKRDFAKLESFIDTLEDED